MTTEPSFEESSDLFHSESNQLQSNIDSALNKSERLIISEIVEIYYQVIKVSSISKLLKENFQSSSDSKQQVLVHEIQDIEDHVRAKFDKMLHPRIMSQLTDSIQEYTDNLKSLTKETDQKSKETLESEAKMYKELRELMSTKEFTTQYENGLKND